MSKKQKHNFPSVPKYIFPNVPTTKIFENKNVEKLMKELENDKKERVKDNKLDDKLRELRKKFEETPIVKKVKSISSTGSLDIEKELENVSFPSSTGSLDIEKELENIQFPFAKGKHTKRRRAVKKGSRAKKGKGKTKGRR
jgi:hypothetical protein